MKEELCHCGKSLHYKNRKIEEAVQESIELLGIFVHIRHREKTYKVPRHYIALHGIKGELMDTYGFEEITDVS